MYGIGIRIATYLQVVMTILAEVPAVHSWYAAALSSVNLWFWWALLIAGRLCKDNTEGRDLDMLTTLGDIIFYVTLGEVILPTERLNLGNLFHTVMRIILVCMWLFYEFRAGTMISSPDSLDCIYYWDFRIYNLKEAPDRASVISYVRILVMSILAMTAISAAYPIYTLWRSRSELSAGITGIAAVGVNVPSWPRLLGDILFICPMGDIVLLLRVVSDRPS